MTNNNSSRPAISVDIKRYRIRIHKNTLHLMGNPDYVLLLVNPEERSLAILRSTHKDSRAHHIIWSLHTNDKCVELYSRLLVKSLLEISNCWEENQTFRMYGHVLSNKGIAEFQIEESIIVKGDNQ